ncbi:MAG: FliM/FliN family flagellar motor switch protein [Novosphingobium sp.]
MEDKVEVREAATSKAASNAASRADAKAERMIRMLDPEVLGNLSIDLVAELGRGAMTIHELAGLKSGEVVPLDSPLNGVIGLTLNGALVARGEIVAVDDRFGVRVTEIFARKQ